MGHWAIALIMAWGGLYSPSVSPLRGGAGGGADDGFQCGSALVTLGDLQSQVLAKCGPPQFSRNYRYTRVNGVRVEQVLVDEWTYQASRGNFSRLLTFENAALRSIRAFSS